MHPEAVKVMVRQRLADHQFFVVGQTGNAGQTNYVASKAGIEALLDRWLGGSLKKRHGQCNRPRVCRDGDDGRARGAIKSKLLEGFNGANGTDREIACGVRFLASDEAGYITGQVLHINGGLYM